MSACWYSSLPQFISVIERKNMFKWGVRKRLQQVPNGLLRVKTGVPCQPLDDHSRRGGKKTSSMVAMNISTCCYGGGTLWVFIRDICLASALWHFAMLYCQITAMLSSHLAPLQQILPLKQMQIVPYIFPFTTLKSLLRHGAPGDWQMPVTAHSPGCRHRDGSRLGGAAVFRQLRYV